MAKRGTIDHPKNKRLARALKTPHGVTLGLLETIWHQAAQFHTNGITSRLDIEDALDAGGWLDMFQVEQIIAALTDERHTWLDKLENDEFYIHDWHLHCDDAVHAKLYRMVVPFGNGVYPTARKVYGDEKKDLETKWQQLQARTSAGHPPDILPSLAKPSLSPSKPEPKPRQDFAFQEVESVASRPEDFTGPRIPEQPDYRFPDPLEDFEPVDARQARDFWQKFCVQHHGKSMLRNLHSDSTHKELRHFASAITKHQGHAIKVLTDYYADPPKTDKGLSAYMLLCKLGLVQTLGSNGNGKPKLPKEEREKAMLKALREGIS